tara:strand:- start:870 stop:1169 length:300 start_codon:yes stop_codon:yes gene_type:complete
MTDIITPRAAIRTRYFGPTNSSGSRIVAYREANYGIPAQKLTVGYHYDLNSEQNHYEAAQYFLDKYNQGNTASRKPLVFNNDYYWAWVHCPKEANAEPA